MSKRKVGLFHNEVDAFTEMLYANQVRGAHGTGVIYEVKGESKNLKGCMPSSAFIRHENTTKVFQEVTKDSSFVIGHNRHATKGAVTFENTHPFVEEHITLIHNGTLPSHKNLKEGVEVDSHAICHSIAEIGYIETLKKIKGAFALVWYDNKDQKLRFIRNTERPLWLLESEFLFAISSEVGLAEWIMNRKNIKRIVEPKMCEVGQLYTYDVYTSKLTSETIDIQPKHIETYYPMNKWNDFGDTYPGVGKQKTKFTPNIVRNHSLMYNYIDVRTNDTMVFSPIDVKPNGKGYVLEGLGETLIYDKESVDLSGIHDGMIIRVYHNEYEELNKLLDYALLTATVIQIVWKGQTKSVVVKNVKGVNLLPLNSSLEADDALETTVTYM